MHDFLIFLEKKAIEIEMDFGKRQALPLWRQLYKLQKKNDRIKCKIEEKVQ